jgi:IS30 family transposase
MKYKQLAKSERYYIEQRKASDQTISLRTLAREMGRSHTTLGRELSRNFDEEFGFYSGIRAETLAIERKQKVNVKTRKLLKISDEVSSFLLNSLAERTSPEQLCGRLNIDRTYALTTDMIL